jgi:hypothetical protein
MDQRKKSSIYECYESRNLLQDQSPAQNLLNGLKNKERFNKPQAVQKVIVQAEEFLVQYHDKV